jgi:hypothetical protein
MRTTTLQSAGCTLALFVTVAGCSGNSHAALATDSHGRGDKSGEFQGPPFPGGGVSGASQSLAAGVATVTCGPNPPPAGSFGPTPGAQAHIACLYDSQDSMRATIEWIVESNKEDELVHVRLTMNPDFVDNTYGANAIGWDKTDAAPAPMGMPKMGMAKTPKPMGHSGHTFKDLVGSDHAEFKLSDADGNLVLHFKADYVSADTDAASGYATLGVTGGEGKMLVGDASDIVAVSTSIDRDLNACGYTTYTTDSPASDLDYTPNQDAENWDYRVVYDVWAKQSAFGDAGFGDAVVDFVHASPSKLADNTVDVIPRECPPGYCADPDGCACEGEGCPCEGEGCSTTPPTTPPTNPPPDKACGDNAPDVECSDSGVPTTPPAHDDPKDGPD